MNGNRQLPPNEGKRPEGDHAVVVAQRPLPAPVKQQESLGMRPFEQDVILRQSPWWPRLIAWGIVGVTTFSVTWACFAKFEEAVSAQGKLEPKATVIDVQAPVGGVVAEVLAQDGKQVKAGDLLIRFDQTTARAQLESLKQIRNSLDQENQFYQAQLSGNLSPEEADRLAVDLDLPIEVIRLTKNRSALAAENQYFRAALGDESVLALSPDQQQRLFFSQQELTTRTAAAQYEVDQQEKQLTQLERQLEQNRLQLENTREILNINQKILDDIQPLLKEGGIARVQYLRQEQEVSTRRAEVDRLTQEDARLREAMKQAEFAIAQAREQLTNTVAVTKTDVLARIADNDKQLAGIDSQLTKAIVENKKRIAEIDSQLSQTQTTLKYQDLKAPVDGTVFDLKAKGPGFVVQTSEPILKVVPRDNLLARVFITNQDIGFVEPGMRVDVRIDSFPYSEFGDVKGKLVKVGSDALPPDQIFPFYRFPADIELDQQYLPIGNKQVGLQSGMSVSTNIIIRKRTVMSIFTDLFTRQIESVKDVR
jgi:HlyD family secretion protein